MAYRPIFGMLANYMADAWLHVAIAGASLLLGFVIKEAPEATVKGVA